MNIEALGAPPMTRILIVDDDESFRRQIANLLKRNLRESELWFAQAGTAEEGRALLAQAPDSFDILLADYQLGAGDTGLQLVEEAHQQYPTMDSILFTGIDEPEIGIRAYELGAFRYLTKPITERELVLVIHSLIRERAVRFERHWLQVLNEIGRELQRVSTVKEVVDRLVMGGLQLGFDRARFYAVRYPNKRPTLFGIGQAGVNQVIGFEKIVRPIHETIYSKIAYERQVPVYFNSRELGPSILSEHSSQEGSPDSLGEWASIPLFSGEACIGILNLDNSQQRRTISLQLKNLLQLFAGHAVAALERALRYEKELQERAIDWMIRRIVQRMGDPSRAGSLEDLLHAIRSELRTHTPVPNFLVVLTSRDADGFYTRLHIESNEVIHPPYWRTNSEQGMISWLLKTGQPLLLPQGTQEYRDKYKLRQVGARAARSWMGVPLWIGGQVIGALIVEDDDHEQQFQPQHFDLLQIMAERLAGVIQTAWLHEQEQQYSNLLHRLQQASELIPSLDEEQLWLTTLTLCTASYGAGFERAMFFLVEEGGARLQGRMAIGHLTWEEAKRDWEADVQSSMTWEKFLERLERGLLMPTPLYEAVKDYSITVDDDAFAEALQGGEIVILSRRQAQTRLPADFLARFGTTAYCLIPVKAAERIIGVVILDNIWEKSPTQVALIKLLDNLTNQAGLLYENLRKTSAQEQLIAIQHEVLVQAVNRPLQETLLRICASIQNIAGAHLTAIYPFQAGVKEILYDREHTANIGRTLSSLFPQYETPSAFVHNLVASRQLLAIEDVLQDQRQLDGKRLADMRFIQKEQIRSLIAAPIHAREPGQMLGILYMNYRKPRRFTEHDRAMAEAFAHLAATAISNWRDGQGLRDTQEAREEELQRLGEVLKKALDAESNERQIVELLVDAVPELFSPLPITTCIILKEWRRPTLNDQPVEMRHLIYAPQSRFQERLERADDRHGISNRAMRTGALQNVPDVTVDADYKPRYESYSETRSELDVPILVDDHVVGALNLESSQLAAFTTHHEEMAQRFAHVAAIAIGNVRRQRNLRTVLDAVRAITAPADLATTLRQIANGIRQAVPNLSTLTIWYKDPRNGEFTLADSYFGVRNESALLADRPREDGMVLYAITRRGPLWVEDVTQNDRFASKNFVELEEIHSTAVFPLWAQDKAVGVMFFSYREPHRFTAEEQRLYPILAEVAAASIQGALLVAQAEVERQRFALALDATEAIGAELDREKAIEKVLTRLQQGDLFPNTTAAVLRYDSQEDLLFFTPSSLPFYFPEDPEHPLVSTISLQAQAIVADVARRSLANGQEEYINEADVKSNPNYLQVRSDTQSELAISLWSDEKKLIGVLVLESTKPAAFDEAAVRTASLLAKQVGLALERALERDDMEVNNTIATATAWATEIAHDIEQEIYHIRSSVEALREAISPKQSDEFGRYLATIDESARRLVTAIPPESQRAERLMLDDYLQKSVSRLMRESGDLITLDFRLCCQELEIESYQLALDRILRHLLRNASQAMARQEAVKRIWIETELLEGREQIEIRIADSGPGIAPHLQHQIFRQRFSRNGRGHGGLGLMLVHFLVKTIGGSIRLVRPQTEQGAVFTIRLPLQPPSNVYINPEVHDE